MRTHGCFTCAVAVAMNNYGHAVDPGQLNDKLNAVGGYDHEGLLVWSKLEELYPDVVLVKAFDTTNMPTSGSHVQIETALTTIQNCLSMGIPVMITVDVPGFNTTGMPDHIITLREGWLASDSDGGVIELLADGHKYPNPEKSVYGARILVGSPTSFPSTSSERDRSLGQALAKAAQMSRGRNIPTYSKECVIDMMG